MGYNGLRPGQHRDNRRQRLYDAEQVLRGKRVSALAKRHLTDSVRHSRDLVWQKDADGNNVTGAMYYPSVESTQDYVDNLVATAWFRRRWGRRVIEVTHSLGGSSHAAGGTIAMSPGHRRSESVILHEIAHLLTPHPYAHHGPEFAAILLTLVQYQMGAEHARALRAAFAEHGVKYRTGMAAVPKPDEARRARADALAKRAGDKPRKTTRTKAVAAPIARRKPKPIETAEEMAAKGRAAALRGSDIDRAEASALSRAVGDLRFEKGRRAFADGYYSVPDETRWAAIR